MKKLTFMNIKEEDILDREELRNVMAGSGGCGSGEQCCNGSGWCSDCQYGVEVICDSGLTNTSC
jgi:hypothetical protein